MTHPSSSRTSLLTPTMGSRLCAQTHARIATDECVPLFPCCTLYDIAVAVMSEAYLSAYWLSIQPYVEFICYLRSFSSITDHLVNEPPVFQAYEPVNLVLDGLLMDGQRSQVGHLIIEKSGIE